MVLNLLVTLTGIIYFHFQLHHFVVLVIWRGASMVSFSAPLLQRDQTLQRPLPLCAACGFTTPVEQADMELTLERGQTKSLSCALRTGIQCSVTKGQLHVNCFQLIQVCNLTGKGCCVGSQQAIHLKYFLLLLESPIRSLAAFSRPFC